MLGPTPCGGEPGTGSHTTEPGASRSKRQSQIPAGNQPPPRAGQPGPVSVPAAQKGEGGVDLRGGRVTEPPAVRPRASAVRTSTDARSPCAHGRRRPGWTRQHRARRLTPVARSWAGRATGDSAATRSARARPASRPTLPGEHDEVPNDRHHTTDATPVATRSPVHRRKKERPCSDLAVVLNSRPTRPSAGTAAGAPASVYGSSASG